MTPKHFLTLCALAWGAGICDGSTSVAQEADASAAVDPSAPTAGDTDATFQSAMDLYKQGRYAEAIPPAEEVLAIRRDTLGEEHLATANALNLIGVLRQTTGEFALAQSYFEQALAIFRKLRGEKHSETAAVLSNLAYLHHSTGDYAAAQAMYEQSLSILRDVGGEEDPLTAWTLNNLGVLLLATGDYAAAQANIEQALAIRLKSLGKEHVETATSTYYLGEVLSGAGDHAAARPHFEQALAIYAEAYGEEHVFTISARDRLGRLLYAPGDFVAATAQFEQALAAQRKILGEEHVETWTTLLWMGAAMREAGDHAGARPHLEQAVAIARKVRGEEHAETATALSSLGDLLHAMGDHAEALQRFEQALAIQRKIHGEQHPVTAELLTTVGRLFYLTGDLTTATRYYEQALVVFRNVRGEEHPDTAQVLYYLGELNYSVGEYVVAATFFEQALSIRRIAFGDQHRDLATWLNSLGLALDAAGDHAAARPHLEQALAINRRVLGEEHGQTLTSLDNLAQLLVDMGDIPAARGRLEQAAAIRRRVLGDDHLDTAASYEQLRRVQMAAGDFDAARLSGEQALAIRRRLLGDEDQLTTESMALLGVCLDMAGDVAGARRHYEQALAGVASRMAKMASLQNEADQLSTRRTQRTYLDLYISLLLRSGDDGAADAYRAVLAWKGATLMRQRAVRAAARSGELAPVLAELQAVIRQMSALAREQTSGESAGGNERLAELASRRHSLETELSRRSPRAGVEAALATIDDLAAALPPGSALVDYFECTIIEPSAITPGTRDMRTSFVAFVVRPDGAVAMFDLGDVTLINTAIAIWRISFGSSAEAQDMGAMVREIVWDPIQTALGDAELVLVSPDGLLGKLPFAALPGKIAGTFLIEDVTLATVPVAQLLPELVASKVERALLAHELLLIGGVDYDRREAAEEMEPPESEVLLADMLDRGGARPAVGGVRWNALPGALGEAAAIRELFRSHGETAEGAVAQLSGAAATEEQFRALASKARILHVATHGFFTPAGHESGTRAGAAGDYRDLYDVLVGDEATNDQGVSAGWTSGLVLAGANDPPEVPADPAEFGDVPEDGILTADELAFLPLQGVELVVLSACETGLGESAGGEGLLGIQRAFQVAGARTTVATLWKVDDLMTQRLMVAFYQNVLQEKQSYLDALRNAQLEMLRELRERPERVMADIRAAAEARGERGAEPPVDEAEIARGAPYFWAAFMLSGDWR